MGWRGRDNKSSRSIFKCAENNCYGRRVCGAYVENRFGKRIRTATGGVCGWAAVLSSCTPFGRVRHRPSTGTVALPAVMPHAGPRTPAHARRPALTFFRAIRPPTVRRTRSRRPSGSARAVPGRAISRGPPTLPPPHSRPVGDDRAVNHTGEIKRRARTFIYNIRHGPNEFRGTHR